MLPIYSDNSDDETMADVWSLTEPDGFPVDYLDSMGDTYPVDCDEDCDEDCIATGFCICSL